MPQSLRGLARLLFVVVAALFGAHCVGRTDTGQSPIEGSQVRVSPAELLADGLTTSLVDIWLLDGDGSPLPSVAVTLMSDGSAHFTQPTSPTDAAGHTQGSVSSDEPGSQNIGFVVTLDGLRFKSPHPAKIVFTQPRTTKVEKLAVSIQPTAGSVDTLSVRRVRVEALSNTQAPLSDIPISLTSSRALDLFSPRQGITNARGVFEASLVSTQAGEASVTASTSDLSASSLAVFLPGAPDPAHTFILTRSGTEVAADGVTTTQAQVFVGDQFGNPVPFAAVSVASAANDVALVPPQGQADAKGIFNTTVVSTELGNTLLLANAGNLAIKQNVVFVPGPANANTSSFVVNPNVEPANGISAMNLRATVLDAAGHPRPNDTVLWLSSDPQQVFNPSISQTDETGAAQTLLTSLFVGSASVSAQVGNLFLTQPVRFVVGPPSALMSSLIASPNAVVAGAAPGSTVLLQLRDASGHAVANQPIAFSSTDAMAQLSPISAVTDAAGMASTQLLSQTRGVLRVFAGFGTSSISDVIAVRAASPSAQQSTLTAPSTPLIADGSLAPITLILRDAFGNAVPQQSVSVAIDGALATVSPIAAATSDDGRLTVQAQTTQAGWHTLLVTWPQGSLSLPLKFVAGPPQAAHSSLSISPNTAVADGQSSIGLSVVLRDVYDNVCSGRTVVFGSTQADDAFNAASGTSDAQGVFTNSVVGTKSGNRTFSARINGITLTASGRFVAGVPAQAQCSLALSPISVVADGLSPTTAVFRVSDAFGNPVPSAQVTFASSLDATGRSQWRTAGSPTQVGTTDASGQVTATLAVTQAQSMTVTASTTNVSVSTELTSVPGPADANHSILSLAASSATAGTSTGLTLVARDKYDNPVPHVALSLGASDANASVAPSVLETDASGVSTATLQATAAGITTLTANVDHSRFVLSQNLVVVAASPNLALSSWTLSPTTQIADGNSAITGQLRIVDRFGNPVFGEAQAFFSDVAADVFTPAQATTAQDGTLTSAVTSSRAGSHMLSVSGNQGVLRAPATFMAGPLDANASTLTLSPASIVADGAQTAHLFFVARDRMGNPIGSLPVDAVGSDANLTFVPAHGTTDAQGRFSAGVKTTFASVASLSVQAGGQTLNVPLQALPGPAVAATSSWSLSPNTAVADLQTQVVGSVFLRDAFGNPLVNVPVSFTCPGATLVNPAALTDIHGFAQVALSSGVAANRLASVNGNALTLTAPLSFVAGPPDVSRSQISASTTLAPANGVATIGITVVLRDAQGNPTPQTSVSFGLNDVNTTLASAGGNTSSSGRIQTSVASSTPGNKLLTASFVSAQGNANLLISLGFAPLDANNTLLNLSVTPNTLVADGTPSGTIIAQVTDGTGTPIPNTTVEFFGLEPADQLGVASGTTDANGQLITSLQSTQAHLLSVGAQAANIVSSVEVLFVAGPPSASTSSFVSSPNTIVADGQRQSTLTLSLRDVFGNPVSDANVTVSASNTPSTLFPASGLTDDLGMFSTAASGTAAGRSTLAAHVGNLTVTTSLSLIAGPLNAQTSGVVLSPNQVTADGVTQILLSAQAQDAFSNPRPSAHYTVVAAGGAQNVVGLPADGTMDSTGHISLPLTTRVAQALNLIVTIEGVQYVAPAEFVAGAPNAVQSTWTGPSGGIVADGNTPATFVLVLKDMFGNPVANDVVSVASNDGNVIVGTPNAITQSGGRAVFTGVSTRAGPSVFVATAGNVLLSSSVMWVSGPAITAQSTLAVDGAPAIADLNSRVLLTLVARDAYGNAAAQAPVNVSTSSGQLQFTDLTSSNSSVATTQALSGTTDAAGQWRIAAVSSVAELKTVVFSVGQASLTQTFQMLAGAPNAITSSLSIAPAQVVADGGSQATLVVLARDAFGNLDTSLPVTFSSTGNQILLQPTSAVTNAAGMASASLSSTVAETKSVTARLGNIALAANVSFIAGPASNITSTLVIAPQTLVADGASTANVVLRAFDASGNPATLRNVRLSGSDLVLNPTSGLTDASGRYQASLSSVLAGNQTVTAQVDGIALSQMIALVPGPPDPTHSSLMVSPNAVVADGSALGTVQLSVADAHSNPISFVPLSLTASGSNNALGSAVGTTNAQGQWSTTIASTLAESKLLRALVQNVPLTGTALFVPGAPDAVHSTLVASPNQITADGVSQASLLITLRDAHDNLIANASVGLSAPGAQLTTPGGATNNQAQFSAQVGSTVSGPVTVTATSGPTSLSTQIVFVPGPPSLSKSTLISTPSQTVADGNQALTLALWVADAFGNAVPNQGVTWSASGTRTQLNPASSITSNAGKASIQVTSTRAQSQRINANLTGMGLSVPVLFLPGGVSAANSNLTISPNTIVADGQSLATITVGVFDAQGNAEANQTVRISIGGSSNVMGSGMLLTGSDGFAQTTFASTLAQTKAISAQLANFSLASSATFVAGPPASSTTVWTASPNVAVADGVASVTLTLLARDAYGNPTPNVTANFAADGTFNQLNPSSGTTNIAGALTTTLRSTKAEQKNAAASIGGVMATLPVLFVAGPMSPATSSLLLSPNHVLADGNSQAEVLLAAADAQGNPIVGQSIQFVSSGATSDQFISPSLTTDSTGSASSALVSTLSGPRTISASVGQSSLSGALIFFPGPPSALTSSLTLSPVFVVADGNSYTTLSIVARDAFGNAVPDQNVSLSASGLATFFAPAQGVTDSGGALTSRLSSTMAEAKTVAVNLGPTTLTGNVAFIPGPPSSLTSTLTATPPSNTADGNSAIILAVNLRDAQNNAVANRALALSVSGTRNTLASSGGQTDGQGGFTTSLLSAHAEVKTIVAVLSGMSLSTTATFTPGPPSLQSSTLTLSPNVLSADDAATWATVFIADSQGNPVPAQSANITSSMSDDSVVTPMVTSDANGLATTSIVATSVGTRTISVALNGFAVTAPLGIVAGSPNQSQSALMSSPNQITADGVSHATITLVLRDKYGNRVPNQSVTPSVLGNPISLVPSSAQTDSSGSAVFSAASTLATTRTLTLVSGNVSLSVPLAFVPGPISNTTSTLTLNPNAVLADGNAALAISLFVADAFNNPIDNASVSLSASGTNNLFVPASAMTSGGGLFASSWSTTQAATKTVVANLGTTTLTQTGIFFPGPPSAGRSLLIINPNNQVVDLSSGATAAVYAYDAFGNAIANQSVLWSTSGANVVLSSTSTQTNASAQSAIAVSSIRAQNTSITAQLGNATLSAPITFFAAAPNSTTTQLAITPQGPLVADGTSQATLVATVRDAFGNPVPNVSASFAATGSASYVQQPSAVTTALGTATGSLATTKAETKTVTLTAGSASQTATYLFIAGAPNAALSNLSLSPNTVVAGGNVVLSLVLRDAFGNLAPNQNFILGGGNLISFAGLPVATNSFGAATGFFTPNIAQSAAIKVTSGNAVLAANLVVLPGNPNASRSSLVVLSNNAVADTNNLLTFTGHLADDFGNPVPQQVLTASTTVLRYLGVRYSEGSINNPTSVFSINATPYPNANLLTKTGAWSLWYETPSVVSSLFNGNNTLSMMVTGFPVNLDRFNVSAHEDRTVFEAETAQLLGPASVQNSNAGYIGAGYVHFPIDPNAGLTLPFFYTSANPNTSVSLRYKCGGSVTVSLALNGNALGSQYLGYSTSNFGLSNLFTLPLLQGNNTLTIQYVSGAYPLLIDEVMIVRRGPTQLYQAESGTLSGAAQTLSNIAGYTGTGFVSLPQGSPNAVAVSVPIASEAVALSNVSTDSSGNFSGTWSSNTAEGKSLFVSAANITLATTGNFIAGPAVSSASPAAVFSPTNPIAGQPAVYAVQLWDAFANPVGNQSVVYTSPSPNVTFGLSSGPSSVQGDAYAQIASTLAGVQPVCAQGGTSFSQCQNITFLAAGANLAFSSLVLSPNSVVAGGNVLVSVVFKDAFGNPTPGQTIGVSGGLNETFVAGPTNTNALGQATASIRSTVAQNALISVASGNVTLSAPLVITPGAASPSTSQLTLTPNTIVAGGNATLFLNLADIYGNPVVAQGANISSTAGSDNFLASTLLSDANGLAQTNVTATVAGVHTLAANFNGASVSALLKIVAGSPNQLQSSIFNSPNQITADGASRANITLVLRDAFGNAVPSQSVTTSVSGSPLTLMPASGVTDATGTAVFYATSTLATSRTLLLTGGNVSFTVPLQFVPGAASNNNSSLTLSPNAAVADGNAVLGITLFVADAFGNPITNTPVTLSSSGGNNLFVPPSGTTSGAGFFTSSWSTTQAATKALLASFGNIALSQNGTFFAGLPSAARSILIINPNTVTADLVAGATATVSAYDAYGNPIANQNVTWTVSGANVVLSATATQTNTSAQSSITASSTRAQNATFTAQLGNAVLSAPILFVAAQPNSTTTQLSFTPSGPLVADGVSQTTLGAFVRDAFGNPVPNIAVSFAASGNASFLQQPASATDASGFASGLFSSTKAETKLVTLSAGSATSQGNFTFVAGTPNAALSSFSLTPNLIVAGGNIGFALTLRDAFGNPTPSRNFTVSGGNTVSFATLPTTTNSVGSASGFINSGIAQTAVIQVSSANATLAANVVIVPGNPNATRSSLVLVSNNAVANAANLVTFTGHIADDYGNPVAQQALNASVSLARFLGVRYSEGSGTSANTVISVNGTNYGSGSLLSKTNSWSKWNETSTLLPLLSNGNNAIVLTVTDNPANIDRFNMSAHEDSLVFEAEQAQLLGPASVQNAIAGYKGVGYVNLPTDMNAAFSLPFFYTSANPNTYLAFRYNAGSSGSVQISLNGNILGSQYLSYNGFSLSNLFPVSFLQGNNVLNVQFLSGGGALRMDQVVLVRRGPTSIYQAEDGTLAGMAQVQNAYTGYTGSGYVYLPASSPNAVALTMPVASENVALSTPSTDASGNFSGTWSSNTAETKTLVVGAANISLAATGNFVAGVPSSSASPSPAYSPLNPVAGQPAIFSVQLWDAFANPVANQSTAYSSLSSNVTFGAASGGSGLQGDGYVFLASTLAGPQTICAQSGANFSQCQNVTFLAASPNMAFSSLLLSPNNVVAGGNVLVSVLFKDVFGNPTSNQNIIVSGGLNETIVAGPSNTNALGLATATIRTTLAQSAVIAVTTGNVTLMAPLVVTPGIPSSNTSILATAPNPLIAGGNATFSVTLLDVFGNPDPNLAVTFTSPSPNVVFWGASGPTAATGLASTSFVSTAAGLWPLCAQVGNIYSQCSNVTIFPGSPNAAMSSLAFSPTAGTAGINVQVSTTIRDAFGNPISNQTVSLSGGTNVTVSAGASNNTSLTNGVATASINSTLAQNTILYAAFGNVVLSAPLSIGPAAPNGTLSSLILSPNNPTVSNTNGLIATLVASDSFGNLTPGVSVTWTTQGNSVLVSPNTVVTSSLGQATTSVLSVLAQQANVAASFGNITLVAPAWFLAGSPNASKSFVYINPNAATAGGNLAFTARFIDDFGNPIPFRSASVHARAPRNLSVRYASGTTDVFTPLTVTPNGQSSFGIKLAKTTESWTQWVESYSTQVSAQEGNNIFAFALSQNTANLDRVTFSYGDVVTLIEAENASLSGNNTVQNSLSGFNGNGYVVFQQDQNATFSLPIFVDAAIGGASYLSFRTIAPASEYFNASFNGNSLGLLRFTYTGTWAFSTLFPINPIEGNNILTLNFNSSLMGNYNLYIDQIALVQRGPNQVIEAEAGVLSGASASTSSAYSGYFGTGYVTGLSGGSNQVVLSFYNPGDNVTPSAAITDVNGRITGVWSSSVAELKTLAATMGNISVYGNGQFKPSVASLSTAPAPALATNQLQAGLVDTLGIQVLDVYSNAVSGQNVTFTTSGANVTIGSPSVVTGLAGTANTVFSSTKAGALQVCAQVGNIYTQCSNLTVLPSSPNGAMSALTFAPSSGVAGGNVQVITLVKDVFGNPVANQTVVLSGGNNAMFLPGGPNYTTLANGVATGYFSTTLAQNTIVYASFGNVVLSLPLSIIPASPNALVSTLTLSPNSPTVSNANALTATLVSADSYGNLTPNISVLWTAQGNSVVVSPNTATTNSTGQASTSASSTVSQQANILASFGNVTLSAPVWFLAGSPNVLNSFVSLNQNSAAVGGNIVFTARFKDDYGNSISNQAVSVHSKVIRNVSVRYATSSTSTVTQGTVTPNGRGAVTINLPKTVDSWTTWFESNSVPISIQEGNNAIAVALSANTANLDRVSISYGDSSTTFEAENAALSGNNTVQSSSFLTGFSGSGYVTLTQDSNATFSLPFFADAVIGGGFYLSFRTNVNSSEYFNVGLNGNALGKFRFVHTDSWTFSNLLPISPIEGNNLLTLSFNGALVSNSNVYLDQIALIQRGPNQIIELESGIVSGSSATVSSSYAGYLGTGYVTGLNGGGNQVVIGLNNPNDSVTPSSSLTDANGRVTGVWTSSIAEAKNLAATMANVTVNVNGQFTPGVAAGGVSPPLALASSQLQAGLTDILGIQVLDAYSNPISGQTITYSTPSPNVTFGVSSSVTGLVGTANTVFTATRTGTQQICAQVGNLYSQCANIAVVASTPVPSTSTFLAGPNISVAGTFYVLRLTMRDIFSNPTPNQNVAFSIFRTDTNAFISTSSGATDENGKFNFTYSPTLAAPRFSSVLLNNANFGLGVAYSVVAAPPDSDTSSFTVSPNVAIAGTSYTLSLNLLDRYSNAVTNQNATFTVYRTDLNQKITAYSGVTDANGNYTLSASGASRPTAAGPRKSIATADNTNLYLNVNYVIIPASPDAGQSFVSLTPNSIAAGSNITIAFGLRDAFGNGISGNSVVLSVSGNLALSANSGVTDANGNWSATASFRKIGNQNVVATSGSIVETSIEAVSGGPAYNMTFTYSPYGMPAGVPADISVAIFDVYGNYATNYNGTMSFTSSASNVIVPAAYGFSTTDQGVRNYSQSLRFLTPTLASANKTVTASGTNISNTSSISLPMMANIPLGAPYMAQSGNQNPAICWGLNNDDPSPSNGLGLRKCLSTLGQTPVFYTDDTLRFFNMCLSVPNSNYAQGQAVNVQVCQNALNMRWAQTANAIVSLGNPNYCVDAKVSPSVLTLCTNPNATAFNFSLGADATVALFDGQGDNLDIMGASYSDRTGIQDYVFNGQHPIKFSPAGTISYVLNFCLDLNNQLVTKGSQLQIFTCGASPNNSQQWSIFGQTIRPTSNTSLCVNDNGDNNPVDLQPCSGASGQNFVFQSFANAGQILNLGPTTDVCLQAGLTSNSPNGLIGLASCQTINQQIVSLGTSGGISGVFFPLLPLSGSTPLSFDFFASSPTSGSRLVTNYDDGSNNKHGFFLSFSPKGFGATSGVNYSYQLDAETTGLNGNIKLASPSSSKYQLFQFAPKLPRYAPSSQPNSCLTISTKQAGVGQAVTYQPCTQSEYQRFVIEGFLDGGSASFPAPITSHGLCLDLNQSAVQNANIVMMAPCNGSFSQVWVTQASTAQFQNYGKNLCVDFNSTLSGNIAVAGGCNSNNSQKFFMSF